MKLHLFIHSRKAIATCAVFAASLFSISARADQWDKKTVLTVKQPIQIRETVLQPGQYVLRLVDSASDRHVVQIFQGDGIHIINTVLSIPIERPFPTANTQFSFWETPPGNPKALRSWFYPGDNVGDEFPYPKQTQQTAMVMPPPVAPDIADTSSSESSSTTTESVTTAQPTEPMPAQPDTQQPEETAQDNTPPPAQTPAPPPAPADNSADRAAAPTELPKTASPYPLIGLSGLVLAGLAGMLRLKRAV